MTRKHQLNEQEINQNNHARDADNIPGQVAGVLNMPISVRSGLEGFKLMPAGVVPGPGLNTQQDLERRALYFKDRAKSKID